MQLPTMTAQENLRMLIRLLRLHENQRRPASMFPGVLFVSINLKVSEDDRHASRWDEDYEPRIEELGVATFDSRDIFRPQDRSDKRTRRITTLQYSTRDSPSDYKVTKSRECIFAETNRTQQGSIIRALRRSLLVRDTSERPAPGGYRPVVIVGHSITADIRILERLGLGINSLPVITIMDTHELSHQIFAENPRPSHYTLSGALTRLGCPHDYRELHNSGNGATSALYAMLLLAIRWSDERGASGRVEENRERIRAFVQWEVSEAHR